MGTGAFPLFAGVHGLVPILTYTCIALYVISLALDLSAILNPHGIMSLFSPSGLSLDRMGMTGTYALSRGRWWTLLTAVYLHGGVLHILFNVMWLRQLGYMVEELFGLARAFIIFTVSGITGFYAFRMDGFHGHVGQFRRYFRHAGGVDLLRT